MATYRSEDVTLGAPASVVFGKLDNLQGLGGNGALIGEEGPGGPDGRYNPS